MSFFGVTLLTWLYVASCIALATYVQALTGFAFSLLFIGLIGTFDLVPLDEATNAISVITLIQTAAFFRRHPLRPAWERVKSAIAPSVIGVLVGTALLVWLSGHALYLLSTRSAPSSWSRRCRCSAIPCRGPNLRRRGRTGSPGWCRD